MKAIRPRFVPKLVGEDVELGVALIGGAAKSCEVSTRLVLSEAGGFTRADEEEVAARRVIFSNGEIVELPAGTSSNPFDQNRHWLANGGCLYEDCGHVEMAAPETLSARDHVAAHRAMLIVAQDAAQRASAALPDGERIELVVRNSDGFGHSWGAHLNLLLTRTAWNALTTRADAMTWWASCLASLVNFTGQGKVGAENGAPPCRYQLSQRADFIETLLGFQTTERRPLCNTRDEPHCGARGDLARLHIIPFDANLAQVAHWLKIGLLQILGCMAEAGVWSPRMMLADPAEAVITWSHDPSLAARCRTMVGARLTLLEHLWLIRETAGRFVESGGCAGLVPEAVEIVQTFADTLAKFEARDFAALAPRLDWAQKLVLLENALAAEPCLDWESPEIRMLDHRYGLLDDGLFFDCERAGLAERVVTPAEIERFVHQPPEDTRAWTRGHFLRLAAEAPLELIDDLNWDRVEFRHRTPIGGVSHWRVTLENPLGCTAASSPIRHASTFAQAVEALGEAGLLHSTKPPKSTRLFHLHEPETETP